MEFLLRLLEGFAIFNELRRRPLIGCAMTIILVVVVGAGLLLCSAVYNVFTPAAP